LCGVEAVAYGDSASSRLACRELENSVGVSARARPPWSDALGHLQHFTLSGEEHDIYREAHEEGVDRRSGANQETLAGVEAAPAEEAAHARPHSVRDGATLARDRAVGA